MHRRIAPVLLAVLMAFPVVVPAAAAESTASPPPAVEPAPTPEPSPAGSPVPSADPATEPTPDASADPGAEPATEPVASPSDIQIAPAAAGPSGEIPDATDRYIVMLRTGSDTAAVVEKARKRDGVKADRSYTRAFRGFAAKLDKQQKSDLLADPNVVALVPDGLTHLAAQTIPTGISRVGGLANPIARIDGTDQRVDADVAIVDTGITSHPDLNIAGGYNCSTSDRTAWRDREGHGTHVAGIVGALDNSIGVVGAAPGARVWAVKILNDDGNGLVSWYVCGLEWILAQRDPNDASRPLFEAVNMSVTKDGTDDHNCGWTKWDPVHVVICKLVAGGIPVVVAAGNNSRNAAANMPAAYNEVITVSALADTDGRPGGLGGNRCYSWGGYDRDDTFADFSNYGADVDLIAPGKCILSTVPGPGYSYMSGTSMASPTVAGAVALYKSSRPNATPAEVRDALQYLGNLNWAYSTDPDASHEKLLDVSRIGNLGTFSLGPTGGAVPRVEGGSTASVPVAISRSATFFERVNLSVTGLPDGWTKGPAVAGPLGWTANTGLVSVNVPKGTPTGTYEIDVQGANQGRTAQTRVSVEVFEDAPTALPPYASLLGSSTMSGTWMPIWVRWPAASDPSSPIGGYEVQISKNGGPWGATVATSTTKRDVVYTFTYDLPYRLRVRAVDTAGNWSPWAETGTMHVNPVDDRSPSIDRRGSWVRVATSAAWRGTLSGAAVGNSSMRLAFTGSQIGIVAPTGPARGKFLVYIDGVYVRTLNMRSAASTNRRVIFYWTYATNGPHSITVIAANSGTSLPFRVDAFVVLR